MPTINQLVRRGRKQIKKKGTAPALKSCPQKRGVCVRVYTTTPEAEFGFEKGRSCEAYQLHRSDELYSG
jgi:hypothetical protein